MRPDRRLGFAAAALLYATLGGCGDDDGSADESTTSTNTTSTTATINATSANSSTSTPNEPTTIPPRELRVEVQQTFPHDPRAYTQGLEMVDGETVIESTGLYGESTIRLVDIETGEVQRVEPIDDELFGEGLTLIDQDTAVQLTWRSGLALVYDAESLQQIDQHVYEGEGWGLCLDEDRLVMSDGSDTLTMRDPVDFSVVGSLAVTRDGQPVEKINELECVDGDVYANLYTTDEIVRIDLDDGEVVTTVDASGLLTDEESAAADVLNGIAYDAIDGTFLITGKNWPWMFRVRFV